MNISYKIYKIIQASFSSKVSFKGGSCQSEKTDNFFYAFLFIVENLQSFLYVL